MTKVRKAWSEDYFRAENHSIADGLSLFIDKDDEYFNRLQYTRNSCDIWLVSFAQGMNTIFFIARNPEIQATCDFVSREVFLDFVMENTPEAFEWCLFHLFCDPIEIEVCDD